MSDAGRTLAYAVWELLHALSIVLVLVSPILALAVGIALVVKAFRGGRS